MLLKMLLMLFVISKKDFYAHRSTIDTKTQSRGRRISRADGQGVFIVSIGVVVQTFDVDLEKYIT